MQWRQLLVNMPQEIRPGQYNNNIVGHVEAMPNSSGRLDLETEEKYGSEINIKLITIKRNKSKILTNMRAWGAFHVRHDQALVYHANSEQSNILHEEHK